MATCLPVLILLLPPLTQQMQGQWKQTFTGQNLPPPQIDGLMPSQNSVEKGREHPPDSWGLRGQQSLTLRSHDVKEHLPSPVLSELQPRSLTEHVKVDDLLLSSAPTPTLGLLPPHRTASRQDDASVSADERRAWDAGVADRVLFALGL